MDYTCQGIKEHLDERYEVLMDFANFGLILVGLDGEIIDVNRAALEILGSLSKDATQQINMLSFPPLEAAGVSDVIRRAFGGEHVREILCYTSKGGKQIRMKVSSCAVRDAQGVVCFAVFLMEDITELDETKRKLESLSKVLIASIDGINQWIWTKDTEGKYHVINKSYASYFGKEPKDLVGLTDYDLWPADYAAKFRADDVEVLSSCGEHAFEEVVYHPQMGSKRIHTTKTAICDESGNGQYVVGIARDITDEYTQREVARKAVLELEQFLRRGGKE